MKRIFFLIIISALFTVSVFSQQNNTPDNRLRAIYSEEFLQEIFENNPEEIRYLNWYLDNSHQIIEISPEKLEGLEFLKFINPQTKEVGANVEEIDEWNFNVFEYYFERHYDKPSTYRIGNSGYAIVFFSQKNLAVNFNNIP